MTKILVRSNTCQIIEETDANHLLALDKHLSFFMQGAEHTAAFKGFINSSGDWVKWDGFKKLLTPSLQFATGLLDRVCDFYREAGKDYQIVERRPPKSIGQPFDILDNLHALGKDPYPYQLEVLNVIDKNDRGI